MIKYGVVNRIEFSIIVVCMTALIVSGCAGRNAASGQGDYAKILERQRQKENIPDKILEKKLPPVSDSELENAGDNYARMGNLEQAYLQYDKVLRKHENNTRVRYKRAMVLLSKGMNVQAVKELQEVLNKDPKNALANEALGHAYFRMRDYGAAENYFKQALKLDPKLWMSHNFLGILYDYQGQSNQAIGEYQAAIAIKPNDGELYNNLGISYSLLGDYEKAVNSFETALKYGTANRKITNNLGLALGKLGRYPEALDAFRRSGDEAQAYNNLGCVYFQQGNYSEAARCFEKAVSLRSTYYAQASENLKKAELALNSNMQPPAATHTRKRAKKEASPQSKPAESPESSNQIKEAPVVDQGQSTPPATAPSQQ